MRSLKLEYQTPNKRVVGEFYEIPEVDVINEGLITRLCIINDGLDISRSRKRLLMKLIFF